MKGLKGLGGMGKLKGLGPSNSQLPVIADEAPKLDVGQEDPAVEEIWRIMGGKGKDLKVARQAAKLQQSLPYATTPELLCYLWLKEKGIPFEFQAQANGGRQSTGGSVIDFLVHQGNNWAWRIQGVYWHNLPDQMRLDEVRRKLLEGQMVMGYQIDGVIDIWEPAIYQDREQVLTLAMAGVQVGQ